MMKSLITAGLLSCLLAPSTMFGQAIAPEPGGLQPGDMVEITVWQREELSGEFTVAPNGSLLHPLYQQVRVAGVPVDQVGSHIRSFLSQFESNPQVVVQPYYKVAISGAVMQPDIYDLPPGTTVSQAVIRAGGVTEQDLADDVILVRSGSTTEVDLTRPTSAAAQELLRSGDQIFVEASGGGLGMVREVILPVIQSAVTLGGIVVILTR